MISNIFNLIKEQINSALANVFPGQCFSEQFTVEIPKDQNFGEYSSNVALVLAKALKNRPIDIANALLPFLQQYPIFKSVTVVNPGFINFHITAHIYQEILLTIIKMKNNFGYFNYGQGHKINIEFVSANPTGPMHIGHCRGAIYGDVLANLMTKCGYHVIKEYYINDAGNQIDVLTNSLYHRYLQLKDLNHIFPSELYPGDYLIETAKNLMSEFGDDLQDLSIIRKFAIQAMMKLITHDLENLKVKHDVFFSESSLHEQNKIAKAVADLESRGVIYLGTLEPPKGKLTDDWNPREQLLLRSTLYGDDSDRAVQKSDGSWTYLAADIAYADNKIKRGFDKITMILGSDHLGYKKRMEAIFASLAQEKQVELQIKFCQIVNFIKNGQPFKMSKRKGDFITVNDVLSEVDKDVIRFFMLSFKNDTIIDFDLDKVKQQSRDNPIFYVQYALVRIGSIIKNNLELDVKTFEKIDNNEYDLSLIKFEQEYSLIRNLSNWPKIIELSCIHQEPHRILIYLINLAGEFHSFWNQGQENKNLRFITEHDLESSRAKLILALAVKTVIIEAFEIINIKPLTSM